MCTRAQRREKVPRLPLSPDSETVYGFLGVFKCSSRVMASAESPRCYSSSDPRTSFYVPSWFGGKVQLLCTAAAFQRGMIAGSICLRLRFREMDACIKITRCVHTSLNEGPLSVRGFSVGHAAQLATERGVLASQVTWSVSGPRAKVESGCWKVRMTNRYS